MGASEQDKYPLKTHSNLGRQRLGKTDQPMANTARAVQMTAIIREF